MLFAQDYEDGVYCLSSFEKVADIFILLKLAICCCYR